MKKDRKEKGNCPNLRFPEFTGEWENTEIKNILKIGSGRDYKHLEIGNIPVFGTGGYMTSVNDFLYNGESVCIGRKGTINKPFYLTGKFWTVDTLFYTHSYKKVQPKFLFYIFEQINWLKYNEASGVPSLSKSTIEKIPIAIPKKEEQQKIAQFLSLLDQRIETQNKIIEKLESLIRGIYSATKRENWAMLYLRDVLEERNEQNRHGYPIFSVAVREGIINQIEHLGRSFAAKDTRNYNVVQFGDIVYTKSPTGDFPYGIVKQSFIEQPVAVSPLYGVYKPKNYHLGNILHHYFLSPINANNYLYSLIQKGAKNTINITTQRFLDKAILLPTKEIEIKNISLLLEIVSKKIYMEKDVLIKLETQKRFLLQQMFI
mgnify:CR=1 FL=1